MRTLAVVAMTSFFAILVAGSASAVPSVALTWRATTGTGTAGGSSIDALPGDVLTLDVFVSNTSPAAGLTFAGFGINNTAGLGTANAAAECPSATSTPSGSNSIPGLCTPTGFVPPFLSPFVPGVVIAAGLVTTFDAAATPPAFTTGTIHLGAISYTVGAGAGNETVATNYTPGLDSVNDGGFFVFYPTASASVVVPEPGTVALLGLGLGSLAMIGRRRRS